MFESIKKLFKHSIVYGIGYVSARAIGFLLLPLYTNYLLPEEYGIAALIFTFIGITNVLFAYGLNTAFLRFFVLTEDQGEREEVFSTTYFSIVSTALPFSGLLLFFSEDISAFLFGQPGYHSLIGLSAGILLFDTLALFPFLVLRAEQRSAKFSLLKLLNVTLNFILNLLFIVKLGWGVEGIFRANLISSCVTFLVLIPVILENIRPTFSREKYSDLLKFGLPYIPSMLSVMLMDLIDRFILERLTDTGTVGIYNAGYKLGMFMALVVSGFRFAWHPFFLSESKQKDAKEKFSKILTYFLVVTGFFFLLLFFFIDDIVRLQLFGVTIFGEKYWEGTKIVPPVMLSYILYGVYVNFLVGIYLKKKTKYLPFITGSGAAVNITGNFMLIPLLGMMGAAYSTLIAYFVMTSLLYPLAQKNYYVRYEYGRISKIAVAVAALFLVHHFISLSILFKLMLLASYPALLYLLGFFEKAEIQKLRTIGNIREGAHFE